MGLRKLGCRTIQKYREGNMGLGEGEGHQRNYVRVISVHGLGFEGLGFRGFSMV